MPKTRKTDRVVVPTESQLKALRNFNDMPEEESFAIRSAGGKASAAKRKYRASFKDAMQWALELPAVKGNPTVDKIKKQYPGLNNRDAIAISMVAEAIRKGNVKAFEAVRDTTGESPTRAIDLGQTTMSINIKTVE